MAPGFYVEEVKKEIFDTFYKMYLGIISFMRMVLLKKWILMDCKVNIENIFKFISGALGIECLMKRVVGS